MIYEITEQSRKEYAAEAFGGVLGFSQGFGGKKIHVMKLSNWSVERGKENSWYSACGAGTVGVNMRRESVHGFNQEETVETENFCSRCIGKGLVEEVK